MRTNQIRVIPAASMKKDDGSASAASISRGLVLKPPAESQETAPAVTWHQLDHYDPAHFSSETVGFSAEQSSARQDDDSVQVFPLDGSNVMPGTMQKQVSASADSYGHLEQKLFFRHASAVISAPVRKKLHALARHMKRRRSIAVTVVGHASKRVAPGITDPVRRKMINFAIAQERADAVTRILKKAGIRPGWVEAISKGDAEPNPAPGGMPQEDSDRRAEIYTDEK